MYGSREPQILILRPGILPFSHSNHAQRPSMGYKGCPIQASGVEAIFWLEWDTTIPAQQRQIKSFRVTNSALSPEPDSIRTG
jgi:hypothetical protein